MKRINVIAALVAASVLAGCSSPPKLKFPTGENRIAIKAQPKPATEAPAAQTAELGEIKTGVNVDIKE